MEDKDFEQGAVSIEKHKEQGYYKLVFRNNVKNILFDGFLMKKLSKFSNLNKRNDLLSLISFQLQQEEKANSEEKKENQDSKTQEPSSESKENTKMLPKNCKMKFSSNEECAEFKSELEKIIGSE